MQRELPKYKCHKEVGAVKIKAIEQEKMPEFKHATCRGSYALGTACGNCERCTWEREHGPLLRIFIVPAEKGYEPIPVTGTYISKHQPVAGGYYVVYKDGYESFSPAEAFEDGYTPCPTDCSWVGCKIVGPHTHEIGGPVEADHV